MKALGYFTATILAITYGAVLNGYVISKLWLWFIVSNFQLKPISMVNALGIALLVRYLTYDYTTKRDDEKTYAEKLVISFVLPTVMFVICLAYGKLLTFMQ